MLMMSIVLVIGKEKMRRREKFVIASILLSLGLLGIQFIGQDFRYLAVAILMLVSYFLSAWALSNDLQPHEWLTILPFPPMYAGAIGLFYFLLPENALTRVLVLLLFGIGMYALYLTSNIYSVAKGRNIQLLYAAHAIGLFFGLLTSLLYTNAIFSLKIPFYGNAILIGIIHWPIIFMSLWSIKLENFINKEILIYSSLLTILISELSIILSFVPMQIWNSSLLIMSFMYVGLGVLHSFLRGRLFRNTMNEYSLVAVLIGIMFLIFFPWK